MFEYYSMVAKIARLWSCVEHQFRIFFICLYSFILVRLRTLLQSYSRDSGAKS